MNNTLEEIYLQLCYLSVYDGGVSYTFKWSCCFSQSGRHIDTVPGARRMASVCKVIKNGKTPLFWLELNHSEKGREILKNMVKRRKECLDKRFGWLNDYEKNGKWNSSMNLFYESIFPKESLKVETAVIPSVVITTTVIPTSIQPTAVITKVGTSTTVPSTTVPPTTVPPTVATPKVVIPMNVIEVEKIRRTIWLKKEIENLTFNLEFKETKEMPNRKREMKPTKQSVPRKKTIVTKQSVLFSNKRPIDAKETRPIKKSIIRKQKIVLQNERLIHGEEENPLKKKSTRKIKQNVERSTNEEDEKPLKKRSQKKTKKNIVRSPVLSEDENQKKKIAIEKIPLMDD